MSKTALIVIAEGSSEEYGMNSTMICLCAVPRNSGGSKIAMCRVQKGGIAAVAVIWIGGLK